MKALEVEVARLRGGRGTITNRVGGLVGRDGAVCDCVGGCPLNF